MLHLSLGEKRLRFLYIFLVSIASNKLGGVAFNLFGDFLIVLLRIDHPFASLFRKNTKFLNFKPTFTLYALRYNLGERPFDVESLVTIRGRESWVIA